MGRYGFRDFVTVTDLHEANHVDIRRQDGRRPKGVYAVLRESQAEPVFLLSSPAGWFRGQDPTVPVNTLRDKWVHNAKVLYIGKSVDLKKRIMMYIQFGYGAPVAKWGGRYIWQLADSHDLLVCWKATEGDPRAEEKRLITIFEQQYGQLPFANLRY